MIPAQLTDWIDQKETRWDVVTSSPLLRLAALLDHPDPPWHATTLPPLGHWLYALPAVSHSQLAEDGHPKLGQFLPPIALPRRMWAAGEIEFLIPIHVGESISKRSVIKAIDHKIGRSGDLVFVRLHHEIHSPAGVAVRETQELVYRDKPTVAKSPTESPHEDPLPVADWERTISPDPVLLFRFSAVTFNSHRIHYDRDYAVVREGYPGLVVHGPLIAILLMDLFLRNHPAAEVTHFRFRAQRPIFDIQPFTVCGAKRHGGADLWALDANRQIAMRAELSCAQIA
jgi:3-methylfumaryl-CoA hydratase